MEVNTKYVLNREGDELYFKGQYNEAIHCFDEAIKLDFRFKEAWINKGYSLYHLEKYNEAIQCFDEAIKLDFRFKEAWFYKGLSFQKLEKTTEALQSYDEAIRLEFNSDILWKNNGYLLIKQGKFDEALNSLNKASPEKETLNNKGRALKKKGDFINAAKSFEEALKIDPQYIDARVNLDRTNKLKNSSPKLYFESCLQKLKKNRVKKLDLGDLNIGESESKLLCEELQHNYSLQELNLEDNKIGNQELVYFLNMLNSNHSIQVLQLQDNFIDNLDVLKQINNRLEENKKSLIRYENSIIRWNQIISKKKELRVLIVINCNLKEIPIEINELEELISLDLRDNQLIQIPNLAKLSQLMRLNLSNNKLALKLKDDGLYSELRSKLPKSIKVLYLEGNENTSKNIDLASKNFCYLNTLLYGVSIPGLADIIPLLDETLFWISVLNKIDPELNPLHIEKLKDLNILDLRSSQLSLLPKESVLSKLQNFSTQLILMENKFYDFPESICCLSKLKILRLQNNVLYSISDNISKLTNLYELSLEKNIFSEFPKILTKIHSLERIWLDNNRISAIPTNYQFSNLNQLSMIQNKLTNFGGIVEWRTLQILILSENYILFLPKEIKYLNKLIKLVLNKNKIKFIPIEIRELKELKKFDISHNLIEEIPLFIGELTNLEFIDISNNKIRVLPTSMGLLTKLTQLNLSGNPIISPPLDISNNLNELKGYWKDLLVGGRICNFLKLIIVGEENSGKTTLVRTLNKYNNSLLKNVGSAFKNKPLSTDGIDISVQPFILSVDRAHSLPNNELIFNIWDFGGQEVYHSTHIFFLSPNSIYLIVWNMDKKQDAINRLVYWIHTLNSYAKDPLILLVGTHLDCVEKRSSSKNVEEGIYENVSIQTGISKEYIIGVSCKTGKNYDKLLQKIKFRILGDINQIDLPTNRTNNVKLFVGEVFPKMYFDLKTIMDEEANKRIKNDLVPILKWKEFKLIAEKTNVVQDEELKRGLFFLHCLGFCLYFSKDKELSNYIILNSQWLADTMATLITTKSQFIQKGSLNHQHFKHVWKEPQYPPKIHSFLIDILTKFGVLIPITHDIEGDIYLGSSVVPALLSNENKPINLSNKGWTEGKPIEIQRIYQFDSFLPSQIFSQFTATIFSLFGLQKDIEYWRDGILIKKEKIKCLIELDSLTKSIIISFIGKNFISLLKQIQIRLEMVLNKWENLTLEIYVTCPICSNSTSSSNQCFKLQECFQAYSNQINNLICNKSKAAQNKLNLTDLLPELDLSEIKQIIEWDELDIENKIGQGSFAEVYKGKYETQFVAIKKLNFSDLNDKFETSESIREFLLELGFLTLANHNNLLQMIGIVLSPPSIILPFAKYGSLFNVIYVACTLESFQLATRIALDIILGLNYLHSLTPSIVHCDLKSENVLIMSLDYKDPDCVCKISDFGLSQFSVGKFLVNKKLNPRWCAPEVIQNKDQSVYSDIYSFGIILYELLTKEIPYSTKQNPEWSFMHHIAKAITEGIRPSYLKENIEKEFRTKIPNQIYEIMELCWSIQPINRPNSRLITNVFYSILSNYWKEIRDYIEFPS